MQRSTGPAPAQDQPHMWVPLLIKSVSSSLECLPLSLGSPCSLCMKASFRFYLGSFQGFQPTCSKEAMDCLLWVCFFSFSFSQLCRKVSRPWDCWHIRQVEFFVVARCPLHCRMLSSIPALHPLDAESISFLKDRQPNISSDIVKCF